MVYRLLSLVFWISSAVSRLERPSSLLEHFPWTFHEPGNRWYKTQNWSCFMPSVEKQTDDDWNKQYTGAIIDFKDIRDLHHNESSGQQGLKWKQLILIKTASTKSDPLQQVNETWIFSWGNNKWTLLKSNTLTLSGEMFSVVTLCNSQVFVIGGSTSNSSRQSGTFEGVFMFSGDARDWVKPHIKNNDILMSFHFYFQEAAVAVEDNSTGCQCKESVLLFPSMSNWSTIFQLKCVVDGQQYVWKKISSTSGLLLPQMPLPGTVASQSNYAYVLAGNGLWQFDLRNNDWSCINNSMILSRLPCGLKNSRAYSTSDKYIVYGPQSCHGILVYDFEVRKWSRSSRKFSLLDIFSGLPWVKVNRKDLLLLDRDVCEISVAKLTKSRQHWKWTTMQTAFLWPWSPIYFYASVLIGDYFYVAEGGFKNLATQLSNGQIISSFLLWRLDIKHLIWERIWPSLGSRGSNQNFADNPLVYSMIYMSPSLLVMIGGSKSPLQPSSHRPHVHVWAYNTINNSVFYYETEKPTTTSAWPVARESYVLAPINATSFLLFGGAMNIRLEGNTSASETFVSRYRLMNDTWVGTIQTSRKIVKWTELDDIHRGNRSPYGKIPRGGTKYTMVNTAGAIVLYGGQAEAFVCLNEIWHFNVTTMRWVNVTDTKQNYKPELHSPCFSTGTRIGNDVLLAINCSPGKSTGCSSFGLQLWLYQPNLLQFTFISLLQDQRFRPSIDWTYSLHIWRQYLVIYDSVELEIVYSRLVCPAGFSTSSVPKAKTFCDVCQKGLYSPTIASQCIQCPEGLTTEKTLSSSAFNCSQCIEGYCRHGSCDISLESTTLKSVCHCRIGFSGHQCQYPTYFLIGMGVVCICLVVLVGSLLFYAYRRKKRRRERKLVHKINELTQVWQIDFKEVNLLERIGRGNFGDVFSAEYRDMTVAIKRLRCPEDEQSLREFEREIEFLQTVRHPNIVLFIGAGRQDDEGLPFFVTEFMERGSLRDVLDDVGLEILIRQKIQFAIDIASGMEFLHGLEPPRIHRDLKCSNILVSRNLTAKVADFGLGRQMPSENANTSLNEPVPEGLATPLLNNDNLTVQGIGTKRWLAPEISSHGHYTTAIDVYRLVSFKKRNQDIMWFAFYFV